MKRKNDTDWEGYTLDEIRFASALNDARIDLCTHKLRQMAEPYSSPTRAASTVLGRLVNALSYMDYIVLGYKAVRHIYRWFRK